MTHPGYEEIFVAGGFPVHTYNPRLSLQLESRVGQATQNLCKMVIVTGHTKSGKTVLVNKVFPASASIWVDGGSVRTEDDFWNQVVEVLDAYTTVSEQQSRGTAQDLTMSVGVQGKLPFVQGKGGLGGRLAASRDSTTQRSRSSSPRVAALGSIRRQKRPLVIDDFHYIPRDMQGSIVRALKRPVYDGVPVVLIAIPHKRYDAVKVEREMTGRTLPVDIPPWSEEELRFIPTKGFGMLDIDVEQAVTDRLATESIGSPHLMQTFCRSICEGITRGPGVRGPGIHVRADGLEDILRQTADAIGKPMFDKLALGPRARADRKQRRLKTGETVDIYRLVLHALAHARPGLTTLEYTDLRSAVREVSADDPPSLQEIGRVLRKMSEIAATDPGSSPIIDFDERESRLHVTDPFFAFYLRWGTLVARRNGDTHEEEVRPRGQS